MFGELVITQLGYWEHWASCTCDSYVSFGLIDCFVACWYCLLFGFLPLQFLVGFLWLFVLKCLLLCFHWSWLIRDLRLVEIGKYSVSNLFALSFQKSLSFSVKMNPAFCNESSHSIVKVPGLSGILVVTFGINPLGVFFCIYGWLK